MNSESLYILMALASREAIGSHHPEIEPEHITLGILKLAEIDFSKIPFTDHEARAQIEKEQKKIWLTLRDHGLNSTTLRRRLRAALGRGNRRVEADRLHRSPAARSLFDRGDDLVQDLGEKLLTSDHLLTILLKNPPPVLATILDHSQPQKPEGATVRIPTPGENPEFGMKHLSTALQTLTDELKGQVFGQDHAIHAFVEGLWAAEMVATADLRRHRPKAFFIFAGPPGVGKTLLAETGSRALDRPYLRFDMSTFSGHQSESLLIGSQPAFRGAQSGQLTSFVENNPDSILVFDGIEKAHPNLFQLFQEILDRGYLEDKYTEKKTIFRDTVVIFTTTAGSILYNRTNISGIASANDRFHRRTVLDALTREYDPRTGRSLFPEALASRLTDGYPLMFNRLAVNDLERIARAEIVHQGSLIQHQYGTRVDIDDVTPMCLVLREGSEANARTIRSEAETFLKTEFFKICRLFETSRIDEVLAKVETIDVGIDCDQVLRSEIKELLQSSRRARILLIADDNLSTLWSETMTEIHWIKAKSLAEVFDALAVEDIDLILLDLWLGYESLEEMLVTRSIPTETRFEKTPLAASSLSLGGEILRKVHARRPDLPCFLLSMSDPERPTVDDEFFLSCVRSGGARGLIRTGFVADGVENWVELRNLLQIELSATAEQMWRENKARQLGHEHRHLAFDTTHQLSEDGRTIRIKLRDMRLERVIVAQDAAELLDDVERPSLGFGDVFGGDTAKMELRDIVDWFVGWPKEPKHLEPMHSRPPNSLLFHGKPGTGKTMLARALAGQLGATFIAVSATSFVKEWQESGPQSIRHLFARANRYAPAIVFIDRIDAIANNRNDRSGKGAAFEQTLNALLSEIDGLVFSSAQPTIVIAATNFIETLDIGLTKRFDRVVEIEPPDYRPRLLFLEQRLMRTERHRISAAVIDRLACQTATKTISDLERLIECALRIAAQSNGAITDQILDDAFAATQVDETQRINDQRRLLHIARHEAGHALVGWLAGNRPAQISILARNSIRGSVEPDLASRNAVFDKLELETMIRQLMAGRAGEMLYYGDNEGLSSFASSDLETATHYAEIMVRHYGMDSFIGPVYLDAHRFDDGPIVMEVMHAASRILKKQLSEAREILEAHREMLDTLVDHLLKWNRLTTEELEKILG